MVQVLPYIDGISRKIDERSEKLAEWGIVPYYELNGDFLLDIIYELKRTEKMIAIDQEYRELSVKFNEWESMLENRLN